MPGQVIKVRRQEHLGWAQRLYLPMIFVGLMTTARHFFVNLWGYMVGRKKTFVVQYPEEAVGYPPAFRWSRRTRCTPACRSCATIRSSA